DITKPFIDVQLQRLSLVNMNNSFYYFQRVSDNGLNGLNDNVIICGAEKPWYQGVAAGSNSALFDPTGGNYVVDYYAQQKYTAMEQDFKGFLFSEYFDYPLFEDNGTINSENLSSTSRWASSEISNILAGEKDDYTGDDKEDKKTEYHIWRYVTENTIPFINNPYEYFEPNGISTGVVFRAKIIGNMKAWTETPTTKEEEQRNHLIKVLNSTKLDADEGTADVTEENFTWKNPILYMYAKRVYATWDDMRWAAIDASLTWKIENGKTVPDWNRTNSLYMAVFGRGVTGMTITDVINGEKVEIEDVTTSETNEEGFTAEGLDESSANYAWEQWNKADKPGATNDLTRNFKKAMTDAGITLYQRSKENGEYGYFCYYYYWNRHNDNNRDGVMGPMEFCTVRNNVYKLSVSKVSRLGHPRLDENDPDTPTPNTPDEKSDVYITVDSKVIPWVVRINEIEF
ncbi:MAG: fimbria major subunit, partial [Muribaculaceae bacterium]|nr:fimbria major subunit [Muribaculaceae bacterium]